MKLIKRDVSIEKIEQREYEILNLTKQICTDFRSEVEKYGFEVQIIIYRTKKIFNINNLKDYYASYICISITRDGKVVEFDEGDLEDGICIIYSSGFFNKYIEFLDKEVLKSEIIEAMKGNIETIKQIGTF